jgi:hypothetical protein
MYLLLEKVLTNMKNLSKSVDYISLYCCSILAYGIIGLCNNSKKYLDKFRENKLIDCDLSSYQIENIKSDWNTVKYGTYVNLDDIVIYSLFWPITIAIDIIPTVVLLFNPKKK